MIPKKIHYCWFGGKEIPKKDIKCIESWKRFCPDYEIIEWNETNYDISKNAYMQAAYENRKWGFVPDFARFDIIYTHGGIYMDTDVEIIRPIDDFLQNAAYMGFEEGNFVNGGIGFGAEAGNPVMKMLRDMYENLSFYKPDGSLNLKPSPYFITEALEGRGLVRNNELQRLESVTVYPIDFFSPKELSTDKLKVTNRTCTIHHYNASWFDEKGRRNLLFSQRVNRLFGKKIGGYILNGRIALRKKLKRIYLKIVK